MIFAHCPPSWNNEQNSEYGSEVKLIQQLQRCSQINTSPMELSSYTKHLTLFPAMHIPTFTWATSFALLGLGAAVHSYSFSEHVQPITAVSSYLHYSPFSLKKELFYRTLPQNNHTSLFRVISQRIFKSPCK